MTDLRLRPLAVAAADGHRTIRADLWTADRLTTIVRDHGRAVYAAFDREAATLFDRGKSEHDVRVLDELCRAFPVALVVPDALLELGAMYEAAHRLTDAAHAFKRVLASPASDAQRALALWRLAHVYEERKLLLAARDTYLDLQARFGGARLPGKDGDLAVADKVSGELARPLYASLVADRPRPPTAVPMFRRWHLQVPVAHAGRVITAVGVAPSLEVSKIVLVEKTGLRLLDQLTGATRWSAEPGAQAVWAGYLADKLIAATPQQIVALELAQGTVAWRFGLSQPAKNGGQVDPFSGAKPPVRPSRPTAAARSCASFSWSRGVSSACAAGASCWPSTAIPARSIGRSRPPRARSTPISGSAPTASPRRSTSPTSSWS